MRKLGTAQMGYLDAMAMTPSRGVSKGDIPGRDWRIIDRLEELGLCRKQWVQLEGECYLITDKGAAVRQAAR